MRLRLLGIGGFLAIWSAACSVPGGTVAEQTAGLKTLEGTFGGNGADCPLIDVSGDPTYLIFPSGWLVQGQPLQLEATSGAPLAASGDRIRITGVQEDGATLCGPGIPFVVTTLERIP